MFRDEKKMAKKTEREREREGEEMLVSKRSKPV